MALYLCSQCPSLVIQNPKPSSLRLFSLQSPKPFLSFSSIYSNPNKLSPFRIKSSLSSNESDSDSNDEKSSSQQNIVDEWGEKSEPEPPQSSYLDVDPPKDEDEWGGNGEVEIGKVEKKEKEEEGSYVSGGNGSAVYDKIGELKRSLVDTFYCTDLGFNTSSEVRAEVSELVTQLEALNPIPAPSSSSSLGGNWVLLYTAFSELLPLLAAGTTPLLKIKKIGQSIDTRNFTIENSTTFSSPFATFSFSASAIFEIRSPSRIQVSFKEGILNPPEISSSLPLPENLDVFGQNLDLSVVQRSLTPLQDIVANISRIISGQPPLKLPIPGERSSSWLLTTYLDDDFRISKGDGGLFILAKEGSRLLDQ
ncbi:Plastid lipid-associated protein chloroplastic-like [Thalictrum thalictroides]|uniref:Plastid lipid-associated protein chloroplastic-like n=1 Tax=Thalictrum thalictroides TaxID=46969 RepID=A0A7J6XEZ4_THATH|nr:Plastid lipid-associated protein chloroplastic-like [Thalictrum thalictroides]